MTENTAKELGYVFTGATARASSPEECKQLNEEAKYIRSLGFKCYTCYTLTNSWGGGCKMLYADHDYVEYEYIKDLNRLLQANAAEEKIKSLEEAIKTVKLNYVADKTRVENYIKNLDKKDVKYKQNILKDLGR